MKIYYVASPGNWILVKAANKRAARSAGVNEFGRGRVAEVREATPASFSILTGSSPIKTNTRFNPRPPYGGRLRVSADTPQATRKPSKVKLRIHSADRHPPSWTGRIADK